MPFSPSSYTVLVGVLSCSICAQSIAKEYVFESSRIKTVVKPPLTLAIDHHEDVLYHNYYASEKYDGIRAFWNGEHLMTRSGRVLQPPKWFTDALPNFAIEGELWLGHSKFSDLQSIVLSANSDMDRWSEVRFMLFDIPEHQQGFTARYQTLVQWCQDNPRDHLVCTVQKRIMDKQQVFDLLDAVTRNGGEGVMLRHAHMRYIPGRNASLIKLKTTQDGEARVVGYRLGTGKYRGMVGSLHVEIAGGVRFYLGSGLTDYDRQHPPKLGDVVTYEYTGYTSTGLPRFARYKRVRELE